VTLLNVSSKISKEFQINVNFRRISIAVKKKKPFGYSRLATPDWLLPFGQSRVKEVIAQRAYCLTEQAQRIPEKY
jgi:hypothetical protein